jgi:adenylyltransferase/sulfurtransferase
MLNETQKQLYLRNTILAEIGENGQEKLLNSKILVIGAGGLGSTSIYYLAAAGIGKIGIIDDDVVELSNLQRQIIHGFEDIGRDKVSSAKEKINNLNKEIQVATFKQRANLENLDEISKNYDLILDCTDNFASRFIINEFCFKAKKPLIFAAVKAFQAQISVFKAYEGKNPCYCCFNPNIVDENFTLPLAEKGILGSVAGSAGAIQATTAIKEILGIGEDLTGKILFCDFLKNDFRKITLKKSNICKICG